MWGAKAQERKKHIVKPVNHDLPTVPMHAAHPEAGNMARTRKSYEEFHANAEEVATRIVNFMNNQWAADYVSSSTECAMPKYAVHREGEYDHDMRACFVIEGRRMAKFGRFELQVVGHDDTTRISLIHVARKKPLQREPVKTTVLQVASKKDTVGVCVDAGLDAVARKAGSPLAFMGAMLG